MTRISQIDDRCAALAWCPISSHADIIALGTKVRCIVVAKLCSTTKLGIILSNTKTIGCAKSSEDIGTGCSQEVCHIFVAIASYIMCCVFHFLYV